MNRLDNAKTRLRKMDSLAAGDSFVHRLHPLAKLFITVLYLIAVTSFDKYDLSGVIVMLVFPVILYSLADIPVSLCFKTLFVVMPFVCAVGIVNPLFDRAIMLRIGSIAVSGGVISMLSLFVKGILTLMMSFLLIATTQIDSLCAALRKIGFSKMLVTLLLLTFRYVGVMIDEISVMTDAYSLRAPGQKGVHISAWGSFLGQLLLRSMDKADELYNSMLLRGFEGEFHYAEAKKPCASDAVFTAVFALLILAVRLLGPAQFIGGLFVR